MIVILKDSSQLKQLNNYCIAFSFVLFLVNESVVFTSTTVSVTDHQYLVWYLSSSSFSFFQMNHQLDDS